jgi:hypothetical protein
MPMARVARRDAPGAVHHVLLRYVHLNPLRAGLVRSIEEVVRCPWTGHAGLMGVAAREFQAVDEVLGWFAPELRRWMSEGQLGDGNRSALAAAEHGTPAGGLRLSQPSMPLALIVSPDAEPPEVRANEHRL